MKYYRLLSARYRDEEVNEAGWGGSHFLIYCVPKQVQMWIKQERTQHFIIFKFYKQQNWMVPLLLECTTSDRRAALLI